MRMKSAVKSAIEIEEIAHYFNILILLFHLYPAFYKYSFLLLDAQALLIYLNRLYCT